MSILSGLRINKTQLKVSDLEKLTKFYQTIIGLQLVKSKKNIAMLGINNKILLELIEDKNASLGHQYNGLYHIAFLLPSKKDLANILVHLAKNEIRFGASDHGFSNALYLNDPDGNGIEIYVDTARESWPFLQNNTLEVISQRLDLYSLAKLADKKDFSMISNETKIGHLHLNTNNIDEHRDFYIGNLGMDLMIQAPQAIFASVDGYHHHIAANSWDRPIGKLPNGFLGLQSYSVSVKNYYDLKTKLSDYPSFIEYDNTFSVIDPNGILLIFDNYKSVYIR